MPETYESDLKVVGVYSPTGPTEKSISSLNVATSLVGTVPVGSFVSMCETAAGSECAPLLAQARLQWTQLSRPLPH